MVAIAQRVPAHVIGDGKHTVRELVEITNQDPRRGIGHEKVLTRIKVDDAAEALVKKQGFGIDDVPPKGEMVKLADTGNMSTGGISIDRTWDAHEDNVEIAEEAARVVGLDVAGIDFLAPDISQPVRETGGAIVEVNAAPGFRMHTHPDRGRAAVRGEARRRPALPAGDAGADPDRRGHRLQRQDHDDAHDRAHLPRHGAAGRHDVDRRHLHRRAPGQARRCERAEVRADGAAEPARRHGGLRGRARRDPARGPGLRAQRRRRRAERHRRPPRVSRRSTRSSSWRRSSRSSSRPCLAAGSRC